VVCTIDKKSVYCAVRIEYLNVFRLVFVLNVQMLNEYARNAAVTRLTVSAQLRYSPSSDRLLKPTQPYCFIFKWL